MQQTMTTDETNRLYTIKKLFTESYYDYRFSSLFISTMENMTQMIVPHVVKFEYNDYEKFIEIEWDSSKLSIREANEFPLNFRVSDLLVGFLRFCYEDRTMRDVLYSINIDDFAVFDAYMRSIYEFESIMTDSTTKYASHSRILNLARNIFKVISFSEDVIRINLI